MNEFFIVKSNGTHLEQLPPRKMIFTGRNGRFHKTFKFFLQYCYEPVRVADLAKVSKFSRRGLHKAFQKHIGQSPGRELRRMRIEEAKRLLAGSNYNLKLIAKMSGYRSMNSFWVSFRKVVGESPGKFRSRFS